MAVVAVLVAVAVAVLVALHVAMATNKNGPVYRARLSLAWFVPFSLATSGQTSVRSLILKSLGKFSVANS